MKCGLGFGGGVNSYDNKWEDHPSHWEPPTPPAVDSALELFCHLRACLLAYRLEIKVCLNLTCPVGSS